MFPGKLITIVGNSGAGKTTLVQALQIRGRFTHGLESHADRPFQARLAAGLLQYALPNQVDYLLRRAEQEYDLRSRPGIGLLDGGLEQDFWVFTRHFHLQGWLNHDEYELCRRFYDLMRALLPPPDLTVILRAPLSLVSTRLETRQRAVEVAKTPDLAGLDAMLCEWSATLSPAAVLSLDASLPPETLADRVTRHISELGWEAAP